MAKLPRPQAPASFRVMFPDLADWLESPWTGPPPFLTSQVFRLEEAIRDDRYVIRAELPGLDPENDIEVTVDGRILTIRAERRQQDSGPHRSEFRYGSLTRAVRLPARVDAEDVTARYDKGVLEVGVPLRVVKSEGTRIPVENADAVPDQQPDQTGRSGTARPDEGSAPGQEPQPRRPRVPRVDDRRPGDDVVQRPAPVPQQDARRTPVPGTGSSAGALACAGPPGARLHRCRRLSRPARRTAPSRRSCRSRPSIRRSR